MEIQTVFNVIWEDRHTDIEVYTFLDKEEAITWAKKQVQNKARNSSQIDEEMNISMKMCGWVYYGQYSNEGDNIRVVESKII